MVLAPASRSVAWLLSRAKRAESGKKPAKKHIAVTEKKPLVHDVASDKRSKGLKQLLKESKQAAAAAHAHEILPDTELYLNSLKGHGDCVVSVEISADDASICTACEDRARPRQSDALCAVL